MKQLIFYCLVMTVTIGVLACDLPVVEPEPDPDPFPCASRTSCISDVDNWKLNHKPQNSDCLKCHTTSTASHGTEPGAPWTMTSSDCLTCHSSAHL